VPRDSPLSRACDELKRLGVEDWHVEHGGKHAKLKFEVEGREYTYVCSNTKTARPTSLKNTVAGVRRLVRQAREVDGPSSRG